MRIRNIVQSERFRLRLTGATIRVVPVGRPFWRGEGIEAEASISQRPRIAGIKIGHRISQRLVLGMALGP
jgi:hypothetical protein